MTNKPQNPSSNPQAEAHVKKLRRSVFQKRKVDKLGKKDKCGYRLYLGKDKHGKVVQERVGSDRHYAEEIRKMWNTSIDRDDPRLSDAVSELTAWDARNAMNLLKETPSVTLVMCVDFYIAHAMPEAGVITVREAAERYIEIQKEKKLGDVSTDVKGTTYRTYLKPFVEYHAKLNLIQLTPDRAKAWFKKRSKRWKTRTWNSHRNRLVGFWNTLAEHNYCSAAINPFLKVVYQHEKRIRNSRKVSKPDVVKEWFRWLEKDCEQYPSKYPELALSVITWFCGIRIEEVSRIGWGDLDVQAEHLGNLERADFSGWTITVHGDVEKTSTDKVNPVPENAKEWLLLCRSKWGGKLGSFVANDYKQRMKKLRAKFKEKKGIKLPQNTARHSWASNHLALYGDKKLTAERLGHGQDADTLERHYKAGMKPSNAVEYFSIIPKSAEERLAKEAKAKAEADDKANYEEALSRCTGGAKPIQDEDGDWHSVAYEADEELNF